MSTETDKHYQQTCPRCNLRLDPYRIMEIYAIEVYPIAHAIKKLLRAGRGSKSFEQDIDGAILTLQRYREMRREDKEIANPLQDAQAPDNPEREKKYKKAVEG